MKMSERLRLGISSCLLGENVRYNGGHKLDRWLRDTLGQFVEFVPVCPEVECGLGVPRETLRLVGDPANPKLLTTHSGIDHTERMTQWATRRAAELEQEALCGFVFKANSPSSGMERVRVYDAKGMPSKQGVGMFARAFMERFPGLPVEEDGRLNDAALRENFIERIFVQHRWQAIASKKSRGALARFHTVHKLLLLAHSPKHYRELGRLVAAAKERTPTELFAQYQALLNDALKLKATVRKHVNVLQHLLGYFKKQLTADEKQEVLEVIDQYRQGYTPLIVPVTLINHFVRKYDQAYLKEQVYLHPHPHELQLRNHA
jgi:uncharacterized protein YbgA (DUF1722 family)/uncharacterized protein YbbK (DUF523 family)